MTQAGIAAFNQTIAAEHGGSLLALARANQKAADLDAELKAAKAKADEDKTVYEASIAKLKARIAELEAATQPDDHA